MAGFDVLGTIEFLKDAWQLYNELDSSGLLQKVEESIARDKQIITELQANPKLSELVGKLEKLIPHTPLPDK